MTNPFAHLTMDDLVAVPGRPGYYTLKPKPDKTAVLPYEGDPRVKPAQAAAVCDLERTVQDVAARAALIMLELPLPVSTNNLYRTGKDGRRYLTAAARNYRALVIARYHQCYPQGAPLTGPMIGLLELYPPDGRWRDLPNMEKLVVDALKRAGAYADDHLFEEWHLYKRQQAVPGYIRLTITQRKHP